MTLETTRGAVLPVVVFAVVVTFCGTCKRGCGRWMKVEFMHQPSPTTPARARAKGTVVKRHLLPLRAGKTTAQASKACVVVGASSSGRAVISGRPVLRAPALQVARGRAIHNPRRTTKDYMLCAFARLLTIGITAVD